MSEKIIPEHVDPFRFAEQGLHLDGIVRVADMKRLSASLVSTDDQVAVKLLFGVDEQKSAYIKGHTHTKLKLHCQRCMEPFVYEIMSDFVLGVVSTLDEANALPDHYEPALTRDGSLALRELIEDELILNLPIIPRHEPDECKIKLPLADANEDEGRKGKSPFQVLESLKHE